ncbi:MAG: Stp1/IreP family PP2C-type Ser/Thr phosphatase, partial [Solirubrobacterales bacterium]
MRVAEQAFRSDTGRQRTANEDSFYARAPVFAVADGMGGAQAGEVASRIAADSFEPAERKGESPEAYLRAIAEVANERIHSVAQSDSSRSGMGTTLTSAMVEGDEVSLAHVGDSRAYLWRDGRLRMLTSDHSLVEELRRQGRISDEQAQDHPQRSIITRALGPEAEVEVDTFSFSARPGDVFVLCSDGLTTMIKDDEIAAIIGRSESLDEAVRALVEAANERGGRDNITVVAFRLEETDEVVGADDGATLIGPSAEDAGLTADRVREAAERPRRGRELGAAQRPSRGRTAAQVRVVALIKAGLGVA